MVCIFDEAVDSGGAATLFFDVLMSLARQWVLRSRLWLVPVAALGALLTMLAGSAVVPRTKFSPVRITATPSQFVVLSASVCLVAISFTLLLCVHWFRFSRKRRA